MRPWIIWIIVFIAACVGFVGIARADDLSARINAAQIAEGDLSSAKQLLGAPFTLSGRVVYGRQLGRTIGIPTANILLPHHRLPIHGVFAIRSVIDGQELTGVANLGPKPTVGDERAWLESHFFDFLHFDTLPLKQSDGIKSTGFFLN